MNIIKEYDILKNLNIQSLVEEVNKRIKEGWKPQGGIYYERDLLAFMQAMVRG